MAEAGQVNVCQTVQQWKDHFDREKNSQKLVVVDFTATWCPPCRFIAPFFSELAEKMRHVLFLKVDVDDLKEVAAEFQVEAMPTFLFLKEGEVVDRVVGAAKEELERKISNHGSVTA